MTTTAFTLDQARANIAASLPGYEARPQQDEFSDAVMEAILGGTHLVAEAGTGTGKSLGYLLPAVVSGQRVIVSTATKALQDQVALKDLPFLREHIGVDFTFALLKGRSNYLCTHRFLEADPEALREVASLLDRIDPADFTWTGERTDVEALLGAPISHKTWANIRAEREDCRAAKCRENPDGCYAERARIEAGASQIVVVNHSLYFVDVFLRMETSGAVSYLGPHDSVVFDEAHEIEDYAANAFGFEITEMGTRGMVTEAQNFLSRVNYPNPQQVVDPVLGAIHRVWSNLPAPRGRDNGSIGAYEVSDTPLGEALADMVNALDDLINILDGRSGKGKARVLGRVKNAAKAFKRLMFDKFSETVRWVEEETLKNGQTVTNIKGLPVDVSGTLRTHLFEQVPSVTMASATIKVGGSMAHVAGRVGLDSYVSLDVGTPFDYSTQAALYVPSDIADPGYKTRELWQSQALSRMGELVKASKGRALLLFTSYADMIAAYNLLEPQLPYTCLLQGAEENKVLAEKFKADEQSVLFGTRSFMTGFDVQGAALELVVVSKLPFEVPTDPLVKARMDAVEARGGNPFAHYSVPTMTLVLKQAFGRLIRHRNDRGVVAILDPRLVTKGYGAGIVGSLPDAPLITSLGEVQEVFDRIEADRGAAR